MNTSRLHGDPAISNEVIEKYVKRFGPVTKIQICEALGISKSTHIDKISRCKNLKRTRRYDGKAVWEYVGP